MKPSSKNEVMNLIVQTYKDLKKLQDSELTYAEARKGWVWFNGANIRFDQYQYLYGADAKVDLTNKALPYINNNYFYMAWEGELPESFSSAYMLSTAKVFLENETEKECIAIYNVHKKSNGMPNILEQYFLPMNDIGAIKMIKVTATDDDGNPADCSTNLNNLKIEYIQTDETSDSVLKMLLVLDQMLDANSNINSVTNEQFEALVKVTPTDIVDTPTGMALYHDGTEISGQENKVFKSSVTILRGE